MPIMDSAVMQPALSLYLLGGSAADLSSYGADQDWIAHDEHGWTGHA